MGNWISNEGVGAMNKLIEYILNLIGVIGLISFLISIPWWFISVVFFKPDFYIGTIGCVGGLIFCIALDILIRIGK